MSSLIAPSDDPLDDFGKIWDRMSSNMTNQEQREKIENYSMMLGSLAIASAVPGFGELQMGLQFLDFIDPYGYNQALTRESLDGMLTDQYTKIQASQESARQCLSGEDPSQCDSLGITPDSLEKFNKLPSDLKTKRIKSITSWATPMDPIVKFPDALLCTTATNPEQIKDCKNDLYRNLYLDYFNKNAPAYQANAEKARQAEIDNDVKQFTGNGEDPNAKIKLMLKTGLGIIIILVALVVFILSKKHLVKK